MTARPTDPTWLKAAYGDLGLREIAGARHSPRIVEMFRKAGHPQVKDDETAWCSAALNAWMAESGITGTGALTARSWLKWGQPVTGKPIPRGAICVFKRGNSSWQGHVAICVVDDGGSRIAVIGGNQSNAVTVASYPRSHLLGARWPVTAAKPRPVPPKPVAKPAPKPQPAPAAEPALPPDIEPVPPADEPANDVKTWKRRAVEWFTGGGVVGTLGVLTDWRVVAALAVSGLVAFLVYWFTIRRARCR